MKNGYGNPECKGCIYSCLLSGYYACDYLLIVGKRRPCPPDVPCTVKKVADKKPIPLGGRTAKRTKDPKIDEKRRELYDQGLNDHQIAKQLGINPNTITMWRRKQGLPVHVVRKTANDYPDRMELYHKGMSDGQIAKALGITQAAVMHWRHRNGLPALYKQGSGERIDP